MEVVALSNNDILAKLNKYNVPCQFVQYSDVKNVSHINQIIPCILLYELHFPVGHWVALFRNSQGINYFDSTGHYPDELNITNFDNPKGRKNMGADFTYLVKLLLDSNETIIYNEIRLQPEDTMTCGYWSGTRLLTQDITNKDFNDVFRRMSVSNREDKIVKLWNSL